MIYIYVLVVFIFSIIQFIEVSSYLARVSGVSSDDRAFAYAMQNAVMMITRAFAMILLPLLGYLVDVGVEKDTYIYIVRFSFFFATIATCCVWFVRGAVVNSFFLVISRFKIKGNLFVCIFYFFPIYLIRSGFRVGNDKVDILLDRFFFSVVFVYTVYALSGFVAFYFGLVFHEYRSTISQLSGVTNALATILLVFVVEPQIAKKIDEDPVCAKKLIYNLIMARIVGVAIPAQFLLSGLNFF